ncbi:MAG TPA: NAD(P)H-quinone oxidoreductase [Bacteroidales bacterium]|nr:NAD(P)H-quinone oxidoreductase [Bacteroidales bacterium]
MKAIILTEPGGTDKLQLQERPIPEPTANEVLIKVEAAGLNRADILIRKGKYGKGAGNVEILGMEVAGTIEKIGAEVTRWKVGDKVCALLKNGGYAQYAVANAGLCLPVPGNLTFEEAASLPETIFTVWMNVFQTMKLKKGENFLVHGGTSGIGVTAIQMAVAAGAHPYATAGSEDKCAFAEKIGALKCVNYKTRDFLEVFKPIGIDVILDYVAGEYTAKNLKIMNPNGRLTMIAALKGIESTINVMDIIGKGLTVTGSTLNPKSTEFKIQLAREIEENVWPWVISGQVKPFVYKVFPLQDVAKAHELMESSEHTGKIILKTH